MAIVQMPQTPRECRKMLASIVDATELGFIVLDPAGGALYMNPSARRLLRANGVLPLRASTQLRPMLDHVRATGSPRVERWTYGDLVLRARLRPLARQDQAMLLELSVAHAAPTGDIVETLAQSMNASKEDARLLSYLWRGLRNAEIAETLRIPLGTVKSRLYRMYKRHGLKSRSSAVLAVNEIVRATTVSAAA